MKILILGGDGMLGHQLFLHLRQGYDTFVTLRRGPSAYPHLPWLETAQALFDVDFRNSFAAETALAEVRPDVVINAVGIVKQRPAAHDALVSVEINALHPHRMNVLCRGLGSRFLHFSTDCVFSGNQGMYTEDDIPDPVDLYGRSKLLGEVAEPPGLTIRSSIIGRETGGATGLVEWFLRQRGEVRGFTNAIFSGLTTRAMARLVEKIIADHPDAMGLYHVSSEAISKHDLLSLIREVGALDIDIVPADLPRIDRSLDSTRFRHEFGYNPPTWREMVEDLFTTENNDDGF